MIKYTSFILRFLLGLLIRAPIALFLMLFVFVGNKAEQLLEWVLYCIPAATRDEFIDAIRGKLQDKNQY